MSYVPGLSRIVQINGAGLVTSETLNPPTHIEYGRTTGAATNIKTNDADNELPYAP
jgi:hypothetical protein